MSVVTHFSTRNFFRALAAWVFFVSVLPAHAALEIRIEEGVTAPLPIAIPDFVGATPPEATTGRNIANVVRADLERSGLFRPLDSGSFIERIVEPQRVERH